MSLSAGTKLGRYEIRSKIGAGGMGEVYLAEDSKLNRKVAIKILPQDKAHDKLNTLQGFLNATNGLQLLSDRLGQDMTGYDLDGPVPYEEVWVAESRLGLTFPDSTSVTTVIVPPSITCQTGVATGVPSLR